MFYATSWLLVAALIALWAVAVWALHGAVGWALAHAGALGNPAANDAVLHLPAGLAEWITPELIRWTEQALGVLPPAIFAMLQAVPALASSITVAAWAVWSLGAVALALLGAGLQTLIARWRRRNLRSPDSRGDAGNVTS